jgi:peptidoglycan/LPS O-acetylase OafA/YrhL
MLVVAVVKPLPIFTTHLVIAAFVGACALRPDHLLAPLFESRLLRHVGVVSYGIYLLNVPVVVLTKSLLGPAAEAGAVFAVATPLSVLVATAAHRWIERPFLDWRDRLRDPVRLSHWPFGPSAAASGGPQSVAKQ